MPDTGYLDWEKNFFSSMRHCSIPYAKHIRTGWSVSSASSTTAAAFYLLYNSDAIAPVLIRLSPRSEEHTSELQSRFDLVCRLLLEKKNYLTRGYLDGE